jgi:hypothetical protein
MDLAHLDSPLHHGVEDVPFVIPLVNPLDSPTHVTQPLLVFTPNYPPDKHGAPRQRQRDASGKLGDSPSTSHDKRHVTGRIAESSIHRQRASLEEVRHHCCRHYLQQGHH